MQVYITEKPSVGKALATYFNKNGGNYVKKKNFYIDESVSGIITWAVGHLLYQNSPAQYNDDWKYWKLEHLPMIPNPFKKSVYADKEIQYNTVKGFINDATNIIHVGDPDREGQLLIDELIDDAEEQGKQVDRILLNALDDESMAKAIKNTTNNAQFKGLSNAGEARSQADWLIGFNLTRYFTIKARQGGYTTVFNVGRVKSPTLSLIVNRERAIQNFKESKFYNVLPSVDIQGTLLPCTLNPNKRWDDVEQAKVVANDIINSHAIITDIQSKTVKQEIKELYSLDTLQIEANKRYGMDPKLTLDTLQSLYEKKLTTYPRSDCKFLPQSQFIDASSIIAHLIECGVILADINYVTNMDTPPKPFNDNKVTAHHAIIPTKKPLNDVDTLSDEENKIYDLIALKYASMFVSPYTYEEQTILLQAKTYPIKSVIRNITNQGWKNLYTILKHDTSQEETDPNEPIVSGNFNLSIGDDFIVTNCNVKEGKTTPPKRYTTGTIIQAMASVTSEDKELASILKEVKGIGTPATRASIIDELIQSELIQVNKKYIFPTDAGFTLSDMLPDSLNSPEFTAKLEQSLDKVQSGEYTIQDIVNESVSFINDIMRTSTKPIENTEYECPFCHKGYLHLKQYKDKDTNKMNQYYRCSNETCGKYIPELKGKPHIVHCEKCKEGVFISKKSKTGDVFYACSNYPNCKNTLNHKEWSKQKTQ